VLPSPCCQLDKFDPSKSTIASDGGFIALPGMTMDGSGSQTSVNVGSPSGCCALLDPTNAKLQTEVTNRVWVARIFVLQEREPCCHQRIGGKQVQDVKSVPILS
jgi:hypothetical protein